MQTQENCDDKDNGESCKHDKGPIIDKDLPKKDKAAVSELEASGSTTENGSQPRKSNRSRQQTVKFQAPMMKTPSKIYKEYTSS